MTITNLKPCSFLSILLLLSSTILLALAAVEAKNQDPNCQKQCGDISIEYPFGIGTNCYRHTSYSIICKNTLNSSKPFLEFINLEVLNISVQDSTVKVNSPVLSSCKGSSSNSRVDLSNVPFSFSGVLNRFMAVGCDNLALLTNNSNTIVGGCMSDCNDASLDGSGQGAVGCYGLDCCKTEIPSSLKVLSVSFRSMGTQENDCNYACIVEQQYLETKLEQNISLIEAVEYVPVVLDWTTLVDVPDPNSTVGGDLCGSNAQLSINTTSSSSQAYKCVCPEGYQGNPYSECKDIDECTNAKDPCGGGICINLPGTYNCSCRFGYSEDGHKCNPIPSEYVWVLALSVQGGGLMILLACLWLGQREYKRRKDAKFKKKNFERNGGPLLEKLLSSNDDTVKNIKLFNAKEMEKATGDYHSRRILGRGGQGIVYIAMLTDGKVVAVKKSTALLDESKAYQFINEIVILSTINHRNVVKILGCCLEAEFPILVYEFIPNGTLSKRIAQQNEENPFPWAMRLKIAKEISVALSYLHSQATRPIFHRDIKSTNILLDERFRAKVADFGISMSVPTVEKTHMTTMVRGTFGYLDPEYFQTNKFTEKSDVYSFGVVLAELLTSLKPILSRNSSGTSQGTISLAADFVMHMEQNLFFEIVDARIDEVGRREEIMAMANLTRRCLSLSGKERPTMKEVAIELEGIVRNE